MTSESESTPGSDLRGYEVLVCVCGGIAAFKVCHVVSDLVQRGAGVTVAMTDAATRFIGPLTFQSLSGRAVLTSLWQSEHAHDAQHIHVTERADLLLIAPATANIIGKIASGVADELVSTLAISAASPVVLAAAMNPRMWTNPIVEENVAKLKKHGFTVLEPAEGWLACRSVGRGRMVEAEQILETVTSMCVKHPPKTGKKENDE
ncbi:MAG: phosphopantothenoylcysteine decarboxylase [Planctomycetes bacterium]|nr:phosphopantothenoylcysteine decarboxylase [Planctomycetota bacterium]